MNHQEQYKRRPAAFHDTNDGRMLRAGRQEERRRNNRAQNFARHRDVSRDAEEGRTTRRTGLSARLLRWKEERAMKKKMEQLNKKPVFKVSVVHHKYYSPPIRYRCTSKTQPCHPMGGQKVESQPVPAKRITRATEKRLALSAAVASSSKVFPSSPVPAHDTERLSFAPPNHKFTAPTGLAELPMFGLSVHDNAREKIAQDSALDGDVIASPGFAEQAPSTSRMSELSKERRRRTSTPKTPPKTPEVVDLDDDVFLEEFPAVEVHEALQNSIDLGRPVARLESYDSESNFDPMTNITVLLAEKHLGSTCILDEIEDTRTAESATIVAAQPEPTAIPNFIVTEPTPRRASKILEAEVDEGDVPINILDLRSRSVLVTPNKANRRRSRSPRASTTQRGGDQ